MDPNYLEKIGTFSKSFGSLVECVSFFIGFEIGNLLNRFGSVYGTKVFEWIFLGFHRPFVFDKFRVRSCLSNEVN
jgi:hypothetical protein